VIRRVLAGLGPWLLVALVPVYVIAANALWSAVLR